MADKAIVDAFRFTAFGSSLVHVIHITSNTGFGFPKDILVLLLLICSGKMIALQTNIGIARLLWLVIVDITIAIRMLG